MTDVNYYKGVFVTMNMGERIYYCYQCITAGGELDVASNTVENADMIIGRVNNAVIVITPEEKIIIGKDELYELLNGEVSKVYGEMEL